MGRFLDRLNKYFMKKHNDLETGRSMVEMLGVLAIVGVITIGGIVGYRYAMDYIMTNAIITGIRARAVIVIQQRVLGYELNLQEFHPNTPEDLIYGRFPVEAVNDYQLRGEEHQALEVFNIPHRVCKNIYNTAFGEEITLIVNGAEENPNGLDPCLPDGVTEDSADEEDIYHNVVAFVFGNGAPCEDDNDCPNAACYECSPLGMCIPKAENTPCGAGGCCDGNGGCTQCVIACDPDEVASTCRTSCDTSTGNWNLKAAGSKCGANNCGVCNSDGQCVGDITETITKCDGTPEVCCAADADCKNESPCAIPCTGTAPACQTCDTTRGEFVADATQNGTAVGACGMCQDGAIMQRTGVSVGDCKKCDLATGDIVNDNSADGSTCGTCGKCSGGTCNETIIGSTCCEGSAIGLFLDPSTSPGTEICCPAGSVTIQGYNRYTGNTKTFCCPAGTAGWAQNKDGVARCCSTKVIDGYCCPNDAQYVANEKCCDSDAMGSYSDPEKTSGINKCCPAGSVTIQGYNRYTGNTKTFCCPAGTAGWAQNKDGVARCCSTKVIDGYCCPNDAQYVANEKCCDSDAMGSYSDPEKTSGINKCCPAGSVTIQGYNRYTGNTKTFCCPAGTAGWAQNKDGVARCCSTKVIDGYCCPNDAQYVANEKCCDSDAMGSYSDPEKTSGINKCCPAGSVTIQGYNRYTGNTKTFCCPAGTAGWAQNEDGVARCCPAGKKVIDGYCKDPAQTCSDLGEGYVSGGCPDGTYEDGTQELDDGTMCYLCKKCPTSSSVPTGICYDAVKHVGPGSCGNYYTYQEITCPIGTICEPLTNTCKDPCPTGSSLTGTGTATNVEGCKCNADTPKWDGVNHICVAACPEGYKLVSNYTGNLNYKNSICCPQTSRGAAEGNCCKAYYTVERNYEQGQRYATSTTCCFNPCSRGGVDALEGKCEPSGCKDMTTAYANPSSGPASIAKQCDLGHWYYSSSKTYKVGWCPKNCNFSRVTTGEHAGQCKCGESASAGYVSDGSCHFNEYFTVPADAL